MINYYYERINFRVSVKSFILLMKKINHMAIKIKKKLYYTMRTRNFIETIPIFQTSRKENTQYALTNKVNTDLHEDLKV